MVNDIPKQTAHEKAVPRLKVSVAPHCQMANEGMVIVVVTGRHRA